MNKKELYPLVAAHMSSERENAVGILGLPGWFKPQDVLAENADGLIEYALKIKLLDVLNINDDPRYRICDLYHYQIGIQPKSRLADSSAVCFILFKSAHNLDERAIVRQSVWNAETEKYNITGALA